MLNLNEEVRRRAEKYFDDGYNCAQAVALSNIEVYNGRTEGIIQLTAGFGHGMNSGCACGAVTGGVVAIGALLAGPDIKGFDRTIAKLTAELHRRFVGEFGLTCCKGLRKKYSLLKNARCKKITVTTAAITLELLLSQKANINGAGHCTSALNEPD
ncbi:putative redox-active protein [Sporotomaculum syntrophicum]|uniref:Redox-active protein n=1 Tax=Sporotomaculum syntrophicum TaxID=182264 RepID=A0A9D2WNY9_9FIRM|nr:C-GCAxxG-C-C family protein [Sporotomaculum syntrophicum]KAF1083962.1 putative redox-active protein [Sporotomaculum syntrophicum]